MDESPGRLPPPHGLLTFTGGGLGRAGDRDRDRDRDHAGRARALGHLVSLRALPSEGGLSQANASLLPPYLRETNLACGFM